jgi:putative membrane-bound dehydrogenase-like protein
MIRTAVFSFLALSFTLSGLRGQEPSAAISPTQVVNLLADPELKDFTAHLNPKASLSNDPRKIWAIGENGVMRVSGEGMGYLRTKQAWRDYHLVIDYQWGERTLGTRTDRARDCGLLLHAYGPDGAYGNTWMSCIEGQLIEGGSGDILVLAAKGEDGVIAPTKLTAEVKRDRDGEPVWTKSAPKATFPEAGKTMARINWRDRDPDWADVKGYRGPKDLENPLGEWNRLEVICAGDTIRILLNGELVNEVTDCHPSSGFIGLQSEYAACLIRRLELHPLGTFTGKWTAEQGSSDMGYSISGESIMPRRLPLSPEESRKLWEVDGDFEVQLVASEPVTCDPVDVVWDEKGRMFVAEMGDYPLPVEDGGPYLSRIRLLSDTDGDGVMDKAVTWADGLDHVQGLMPMKGGLLATTRTAILFLEDTEGDDVADVRKTLFTLNEPGHNQLQVSSPRYGLDNHVWLCNGLDGKQIYPGDQPDKTLEITKLNLRYDPRDGSIETVSGGGQFGGTLDDYNRHFFCSNRNPVMFAVMPLAAVKRNPQAGITVGHEDIQPPGAPVFPIALSHTTSAAHAGTHTAACGIGIYRGDLMAKLAGNIFVCDPTAQLVTRNRLVPNGASFTAERVGEKRDFLVSGDEWSRPVNVRTGPDGALYVCDMYRRFIDHARFFPEDFAKSHYMRAGFDQGRIWRVVPKGGKPAPMKALPVDNAASLVALLESGNGWTRTEAQRILVEKQDAAAVPLLEKQLETDSDPWTKAHALWTLAGLDALKADHLRPLLSQPEIRNPKSEIPASGLLENVLLAAHEKGLAKELAGDFLAAMEADAPRYRFLLLCLDPELSYSADSLAKWVAAAPGDAWLRKAIFASNPALSGGILLALLDDSAFLAKPAAETGPVLTDFARLVAARGELAEIAKLLSHLAGDPGANQFALVSGLSEGLARSPLKQRSLAALIAAKLPELGDGTAALEGLLAKATTIALDRKASTEARVAALSLVAQRPWEEKKEVVASLITLAEPPAIQTAACRILTRDKRETVADFFFERWKTLTPAARTEAIELISASPATGLILMKKMKAGEINPGLMPPMTRWSYGRSTNEEIKALALELFGQANGDRAALIASYRETLTKHPGDPEKGALVFQKAACVTCHQIGGLGVEVGPPLNDVKIKPAEALLTDILDPNRATEERWVSQTVEATDGRILAGLVHGEDAAAITLRVPGGVTMTVPKAEVKSLNSTGLSLMPVGLEAAITKEEMADLIAFLKKR